MSQKSKVIQISSGSSISGIYSLTHYDQAAMGLRFVQSTNIDQIRVRAAGSQGDGSNLEIWTALNNISYSALSTAYFSRNLNGIEIPEFLTETFTNSSFQFETLNSGGTPTAVTTDLQFELIFA